VGVASEGPDLVPADNEATVSGVQFFTPSCVCTTTAKVTTAHRHTLRDGLRLFVQGAGRARVTAAFRVRGHTVRITRTVMLRRDVDRMVTLRAHGAKLRTLRRAAARGVLKATITVRDSNGMATATARVT
jgi:hypothetical protein